MQIWLRKETENKRLGIIAIVSPGLNLNSALFVDRSHPIIT
jgi:hypothetical protein